MSILSRYNIIEPDYAKARSFGVEVRDMAPNPHPKAKKLLRRIKRRIRNGRYERRWYGFYAPACT